MKMKQKCVNLKKSKKGSKKKKFSKIVKKCFFTWTCSKNSCLNNFTINVNLSTKS